MPRKSSHNRRDFLKTTAVAGAALSLTAASASRVLGSNERVGIALIGVGHRGQQHIDALTKIKKEDDSIRFVGVADVWDGTSAQGQTSRGLHPSAKKCGLSEDDAQHVTKDYRKLLELKDVDAVFIGTPDHWHAKISIDAMAAGKDVYCEKPMTRTIEEAHAVVDAAKKYNRVMTVGVQSMADPTWRMANEYIRAGKIGHVMQGQTSYYRNSAVGQWRYYKLTPEMTPKTVDWDMFLGHQFDVNGVKIGPSAKDMPFDRAVYQQWRCYWPFGGGMFTDLFVHQTTHLISAMGVRYPARVVGGGGVYLEYDQRDVPDVSAIVADYDEGCQLLITATMCNDHRIEECIRGHLGTLVFDTYQTDKDDPKKKQFGYKVLPQKLSNSAGGPSGQMAQGGEFVPGGLKGDDTQALWRDFIECVRSKRRETLSTPELGAAAFTTVSLGVKSYREGRALFWDKEQRKAVDADATWAQRWEARSKKHGKCNQIMGWTAGDTGSTLTPPDYQKLAGPWVNGKDPAGEA